MKIHLSVGLAELVESLYDSRSANQMPEFNEVCCLFFIVHVSRKSAHPALNTLFLLQVSLTLNAVAPFGEFCRLLMILAIS